jgi:hypothetical protein
MKKIQIIVTFLATAFLASCGSEDKKIVTDNSPVISVKVRLQIILTIRF